MPMLPGWNSLDAVGSIGHSLHLVAMVVLALVVVAEGMALAYDNRKYALIGVAERELGAARDRQQGEAEVQKHRQVAELQRQLEEAQAALQQRSEEAKREDAVRRLTTADRQNVVAALSPFPGQKVEITSAPGDVEAEQFAGDFLSIARQAGWHATRASRTQVTTTTTGVEVLYREPPPDNVPPASLAAFVDVLVDLHILPARTVTICEDVATDIIRLVIGTMSVGMERQSSLSERQRSSSVESTPVH